jgi:signal transduction histidine kinase
MSEKISEIQARLNALGEGEARSIRRVDLLNQLAWELIPFDYARAEIPAREAMELARDLSYENGAACARITKAMHLIFIGEYETALKESRDAFVTLEGAGDAAWMAKCLIAEALIYWSLGDYEGAIDSLHRSIELCREVGSLTGEGWAFTTLGGVYEAIGDIGLAVGLHARSFGLFKKAGYKVGEGRALSGLGSIYQRQGRYEAAREQHFESLKLFREAQTELNEARALNDIGMTYQAQGDIPRALEFLTRALEMRRRCGYRPAEITTLLNLGKVYRQNKDFEKAHDHLNRAVQLATGAQTKPKLHQAHEALSDLYEMVGDYQQALQHQRLSQQVKENVLSDETAIKLRNLQIRYEVENAEKEAEIQRLRNVELAEAMEKLKQAQAQLIQSEKMAAVGKLVAGVAHEINTPVGVITCSTDLSVRALEKIAAELEGSVNIEDVKESESLSYLFETIKRNADTTAQAGRRIATIVTRLKDFSRLDQAEFQIADVHEGLESTLDLVLPTWGDRIRVEKNFAELPEIECYPNALNQAFMTLLLNASESIEGRGTIIITTGADADRVRISTADSGRGMPPERLEHVFDIGFSQKGIQMRMHTGLANVYSIVKKHRGQIEVKSELNKGTTFEITLPVKQEP